MAIGSGFPVDRRRIDSPQDMHLDEDTHQHLPTDTMRLSNND